MQNNDDYSISQNWHLLTMHLSSGLQAPSQRSWFRFFTLLQTDRDKLTLFLHPGFLASRSLSLRASPKDSRAISTFQLQISKRVMVLQPVISLIIVWYNSSAASKSSMAAPKRFLARSQTANHHISQYFLCTTAQHERRHQECLTPRHRTETRD